MRKVGINLPLLAARSWRRLCLAPFCEEYGEAHQRDSKKNTANRLRHGAPFLLADAMWRTLACVHKQAQLASAQDFPRNALALVEKPRTHLFAPRPDHVKQHFRFEGLPQVLRRAHGRDTFSAPYADTMTGIGRRSSRITDGRGPGRSFASALPRRR